MKTEIACVVDRSGSMENCLDDTIGGFNHFLREQKNQEGEAEFTLTLFNSLATEVRYDGVDIEEVDELDKNNYRPGGCTPLLDAVGKTLDRVRRRYTKKAKDRRPDHVVFCIVTDGKENDSTDYSKDEIREEIERVQEEYDWDVIYIGAGLDAFKEAQSIGVTAQSTRGFTETDFFDEDGNRIKGTHQGAGNQMAFMSASAQVTKSRGNDPGRDEVDAG